MATPKVSQPTIPDLNTEFEKKCCLPAYGNEGAGLDMEKGEKLFRVDRVKNAYYGEGITSVGDVYDKWINDYEEDMHAIEYVGPQCLAAKLQYWNPDNKDIRILDVGCGTGWVSIELRKLGYTNIDGVDASSVLMEAAKQQNLYTEAIHAFVGGDPLPVPDNTYDAIITSGLAHIGHLPPNAITDIHRMIKPGGHFMLLGNYDAWVLEEHLHKDMQEELDRLVAEGMWRRLEWSIMDDYAFYDHKTPGFFFTYKKL